MPIWGFPNESYSFSIITTGRCYLVSAYIVSRKRVQLFRSNPLHYWWGLIIKQLLYTGGTNSVFQ